MWCCRSRPGARREESVTTPRSAGPTRWPPQVPKPRVMVFHQPGRLADEVAAMLDLQTDGAVSYVALPDGDPYAYGRAFADIWPSARDLIVCIARMVPPIGALAAMAACREPLCGMEIPGYGAGALAPIGCTKYSRQLMEDHPTAGYQAAIGHRHRQPYRATVPEVPLNLSRLLGDGGAVVHGHGYGRMVDE